MQYYGYGHYYDVGPDFFKILDILPVFIACLYGLVPGLLCIVPAAISEIVWTMQLATSGPMVNLASFLILSLPNVIFIGLLLLIVAGRNCRWSHCNHNWVQQTISVCTLSY